MNSGPDGVRPSGSRGRGGGLAWVLRVGSAALETAGSPGCRPVDHARGDRDSDRSAAARPHGDTAATTATGQSRPRTATLDWLSGGRLTFGVGIGGDRFARGSPRPASSSMNGPGARCSTRHWRSSSPPGAASRFTTTATTTESMTSSSSPGRYSDPGSPYGSRGSPATSSQCGEPPDTTVSSPPISSTPINSPKSSPPSPNCATSDGAVSTSSLALPLASIPRHTLTPVPRGGSRNSLPSSCR